MVASLTRTLSLAAALALGVSAVSSAQVIAPGYPYGYRYAPPDAAVKFDVKPKEAAVYIDGYYAGLVDDYDGAFQRLRTARAAMRSPSTSRGTARTPRRCISPPTTRSR